MTTADVHQHLQRDDYPAALQLGERAIRDVVTDLETMGLVDTWLDARGCDGRSHRSNRHSAPSRSATRSSRTSLNRLRSAPHSIHQATKPARLLGSGL
ncbi:hypothetical protein [Haloterrigena turkmenica]|uniref:hypothetical protein n=1 Tax=Haloterrigena turkmenica TaxID=62320 RepID=UPI001651A824|nr:hypothetical protein [Haloterrigena turkmenica]